MVFVVGNCETEVISSEILDKLLELSVTLGFWKTDGGIRFTRLLPALM